MDEWAVEETLDPNDWTDVRVLSHRIVDDAVGFVRDVRDRPVWQDMPARRSGFAGAGTVRIGGEIMNMTEVTR